MAVSIPTPADLDRRFAFHPAVTDEQREAHETVRASCRAAAEAILEVMPEAAAREGALVVTKLEEAMMHGNGGIARHWPGA